MSIGKIWQRETTEEELRSADVLGKGKSLLPFKSVDKQKHQHLSSFCYHLTANTHKFELCAFIICSKRILFIQMSNSVSCTDHNKLTINISASFIMNNS